MSFLLYFLKTFLSLPMHTARIPPVDATSATITAVLAMLPRPLSAAERLCFKPLRLR
jgi:hypothetical protein